MQKTEYYLFNAFDQMKAYSDNGEVYGYYGYDDAGQRMYKAVLNYSEIQTNTYGDRTLEVEKMMLYPNGYINIDQHGNYTKHYYADAQRIASKIGNEFNGCINDITDTMPLFIMKKELGELTNDTVTYIEYNFNPISVLQGDDPENYENACFWYSGNHLSSVSMVTDITGNITQQILYCPWGTPIAEYNQYWHQGKAPDYQFNAKPLDEESGMYYYEARYYDPPIFISRDPYFEEYFWLAPYHYCGNNPLKYIDINGEWVPGLSEDGQVTYTAEKGDNMNTFMSQYGLDAKTANKILGNAGITKDEQIQAGKTAISGETVKGVTGNEVLKLDCNSKQATDNRIATQAMFGILHSQNQENSNGVVNMKDYLTFNGSLNITADNFKLPVKGGTITGVRLTMNISEKFSKIVNQGQSPKDFTGSRGELRTTQTYLQHPQKGFGYERLQVTFDRKHRDRYTNSYY
jgi:RHS repeat-associated protein